MLTYLALLATEMLSLGELWPSVTVHPPVNTPVITPGEPSTLALGLIGAATVGLYLAVNGIRRSRGGAEVERQSTPFRAATSRLGDSQQRPTLGAA